MAIISSVGTTNNFLQIVFRGTVTFANGFVKSMAAAFDYMYVSGTAPASADKLTLVTAGGGWQGVVQALLLAALNLRWVSVGIDVRWLDNYADAFTRAATFATVGGSAGDSLPLDNAVTIRKQTGDRGRNYRGSWHFGPISEADTIKDEISNAAPSGVGVTNWATNLKPALVASITNGTSVFKPFILSQTLSQLKNPAVFGPTKICGSGPLLGPLPVNLTLGSMRKRKEKPTLTNV